MTPSLADENRRYKSAATKDTIVEVLFDLDVGDAGQRQVVADLVDDARAGDDALGGDRVGLRRPTQPRKDEQREGDEDDKHPDDDPAPGLPALGGEHGADDGNGKQEGLEDDAPQENLDVGAHVSDDDLVLAEDLLGQCHAGIFLHKN